MAGKKNVVLAYLCAFLSASQWIESDAANRAKVIIVGAGMSGIGFAEHLYNENEKDFVILEARNAPGGRMMDTKFGGFTVNLGAGWIHDATDENPIWRLKKKYGLETTPDNYSNFVVRDEKQQIVKAMEPYDQLVKIAGKMSEFTASEKKRKCPDIPMRTALRAGGWNPDSPVKEAIDYYFNDFENANAPWVLSSRMAVFTGQYADQVVTDERGYSFIAREMVKPFASKIEYNTVVKRIKYGADYATIWARQNGTDVIYSCSYVISTLSSGVLASDRVIFEPSLPNWKLEAVYKVPMGHYTKIFLKFPIKFWDDNFHLLLAATERGLFSQWQNLDRSGVMEGSKMLLVSLTGRTSLRLERLTDNELKTEAMKQLRKMYGNTIPNATEIKLHRWSTDPLTLGAYSSPVVGITQQVYSAIRAPVGKSLWFTGEATDGDHYGYTNGAYIIGMEQAKRFMSCLQGKECPSHSSSCPSGSSQALPSTKLVMCLVLSYVVQALS